MFKVLKQFLSEKDLWQLLSTCLKLKAIIKGLGAAVAGPSNTIVEGFKDSSMNESQQC